MDIEKLYEYLKNGDQDKELKEQDFWEELWPQYVEESKEYYGNLTSKDALYCIMSETNYRERRFDPGCDEKTLWIKPGDICYIDYGKCYVNETGFLHFGVILKIKNDKALVIPMTSNEKTYKEALKQEAREYDRSHIMPIGKIDGMAKPSVLFLNDSKWINTARIIDVKAHIPTDSSLFLRIQMRFIKTVIV